MISDTCPIDTAVQLGQWFIIPYRELNIVAVVNFSVSGAETHLLNFSTFTFSVCPHFHLLTIAMLIIGDLKLAAKLAEIYTPLK